ncbi:hypothetical protein [Nocardia inohanensis]|uniref:hypothetical protein n=1 Tax=Nocardia inohanensis TaxID=209246 RepID=UPI0008347FE1|nr:hypothetical protein [Nocardia inohanensis]
MRTFVHLLLFACAIAVGVGAFGPLVGTVDARNVGFEDVRDGFGAGVSLAQVGGEEPSFPTTLIMVVLGVAVVILLAALIGSRGLGWVGVVAGLAALGVLAWRLDERFDQELRDGWRDLVSGAWGLYLVGGGLVISLLLLLIPRERRAVA